MNQKDASDSKPMPTNIYVAAPAELNGVNIPLSPVELDAGVIEQGSQFRSIPSNSQLMNSRHDGSHDMRERTGPLTAADYDAHGVIRPPVEGLSPTDSSIIDLRPFIANPLPLVEEKQVVQPQSVNQLSTHSTRINEEKEAMPQKVHQKKSTQRILVNADDLTGLSVLLGD